MCSHQRVPSLVACCAVFLLAACGSSDDPTPAEVVRARIAALAPAANLGHRGSGINLPDNPYPENSLASFSAAMAAGADGIELDVELTRDGRLVVMHDDTLDRTTTCHGCVSAYALSEVRPCRLIAGNGDVSTEPPPTLEEVWQTLPRDALVNVELKVYGGQCATPSTGAADLARAAVAETERLGVARRTLFSSFDETAALAVEDEDAGLYSARLTLAAPVDLVEATAAAGLDALHPFFSLPASTVRLGLDLGLQVNVWTVNGLANLESALDKGATAIITDEPEVLAGLLAQRR